MRDPGGLPGVSREAGPSSGDLRGTTVARLDRTSGVTERYRGVWPCARARAHAHRDNEAKRRRQRQRQRQGQLPRRYLRSLLSELVARR